MSSSNQTLPTRRPQAERSTREATPSEASSPGVQVWCGAVSAGRSPSLPPTLQGKTTARSPHNQQQRPPTSRVRH